MEGIGTEITFARLIGADVAGPPNVLVLIEELLLILSRSSLQTCKVNMS